MQDETDSLVTLNTISEAKNNKWGQFQIECHKKCLTLIVPDDSLKCSLLLKSEAYPIFLLLYLCSTALK